MEILFKMFFNISVIEYLIYCLIWAVIYYNLRAFFPGSESFVTSVLFVLACMFGQYITGQPLQLRALQWFDSFPFIVKWLPLVLIAFFTSLTYEKDHFWENLRISSVASIICSALIYFII